MLSKRNSFNGVTKIMAVAGSLSQITSDQIADEAITTTKLHDDSVTNDKLGSDISITNAQLAGSIANSKLANDSVTVNGTSIDLGASGTVATSSKIHIVVHTQMSGNELFFIQLVRGSTAIGIGDSDSSNRVECSVGGDFQSSNNDKIAG